MIAPKVGFVSPFGTTICNVNHINAGSEPPGASVASTGRLHWLGWRPIPRRYFLLPGSSVQEVWAGS
jgi:hypothetical protein